MGTSIFGELTRCVVPLPKKLTKTSACRHRLAFIPTQDALIKLQHIYPLISG